MGGCQKVGGGDHKKGRNEKFLNTEKKCILKIDQKLKTISPF